MLKNYKTNLISLDQIETGNLLFNSIQQLISYVENLNPEDYRNVKDLITAHDLDPVLLDIIFSREVYDDTELVNRIGVLEKVKASRIELDAFRKKVDKILREDLDEELLAKIDAISKGYDDRHVLREIELLKQLKMDKTEGILYRKVEDSITINDLDDEISSLLNLISEIEEEVHTISQNEVTMEILKNYRQNAVKIGVSDLTAELRSTIDNFVSYDDTALKLNIIELKERKADRTELIPKVNREELEAFRKKDVLITLNDLEDTIVHILNSVDITIDKDKILKDIETLQTEKSDRTYVDQYFRKLTVPIMEKDLSTDLVRKISEKVKPYDDSAIFHAINTLEECKADKQLLKNYRLKDDKIKEQDLHKDLQLKLNAINDENLELKNLVFDLNEKKLDKTEYYTTLSEYRRKDEVLEMKDLPEELKEEVSSATAKNREQDVRLNDINKDMDGIDGRVSTIEDTIDELKPTINKFIVSTVTSIGSLNTKTTSIQDDVNAYKTSNDQAVTQVRESITALDGKVESYKEALDYTINDLEVSFTNQLQTELTDIKKNINFNAQEITKLKNEIKALQVTQNGLLSSVSSLLEKVSLLETIVSNSLLTMKVITGFVVGKYTLRGCNDEVTINLPKNKFTNKEYRVFLTPSSFADGDLGELYVTHKSSHQIITRNTGKAASVSCDYVIMRKEKDVPEFDLEEFPYQMGEGHFNGAKGHLVTLKTPYDDTNYSVQICPTANCDGGLGEYWVGEKTTTSFKVYNSGEVTGSKYTFDFMTAQIGETIFDETNTPIMQGSSNFNSYDGTLIELEVPMATNTFTVLVTPNEDPTGDLGEIWVDNKTTNSFMVKNTGDTLTGFDYIVIG